MRGRLPVLLAALAGATGCERILGLGEGTLAVDAGADGGSASCEEGATPMGTRQFVIDAMRAPTTAGEAQGAGFDLDGDGGRDNAVFNILQALAVAEPGFAVQPTLDESLASGTLLQLLQADLGDGCARTTLYAGEDRDLPPDPTDNFDGEESFRVVGNARGRLLGGRQDLAVLAGAGGTAELRLPLFRNATPIDLPLVVAQVRYVITDDGVMTGAIGGAIRSDVVEGVVIPSFAESLQNLVDRECAGGTPPACCPLDSAGRSAIGLFDDDGDCAITIAEVRSDGTVANLFSPDLDLYNGGVLEPGVDQIRDSVSLGIELTAVNAFFLTP